MDISPSVDFCGGKHKRANGCEMVSEVRKLPGSELKLAGNKAGMDLEHFCETDQIALGKVRCLSRDKCVHVLLGDAKLTRFFVGDFLLLFELFVRLSTKVDIYHRAVKAVPSPHMLQLMTKNKKEVVYTIETKRHANDWRPLIEPKADTVNLSARQALD